jgi:hypothetical protein
MRVLIFGHLVTAARENEPAIHNLPQPGERTRIPLPAEAMWKYLRPGPRHGLHPVAGRGLLPKSSQALP